MKKDIVMVILVLAFIINLVIAVTPVYGSERADFCAAEDCTNGGGPVCATKKFKKGGATITWYCYYGP